METIETAAIRKDGVVYTLPRPARHGEVMASQGTLVLSAGGIKWKLYNGAQGFVTSIGRFVGRKEAHVLAKRAGQLIPRKDGFLNDKDGAQLFSEDLW